MMNDNMKKLENDTFDPQNAESYVNEIKKIFPRENISILNVNDYYEVYNNSRNCMFCKGIENCKNRDRGYALKVNNGMFYQEACKYEKQRLERSKKTSLINTLYLPQKILDALIDEYNINSDSRKKIMVQITKFLNDLKSGEKAKGLYLFGDFAVGKTYTLAVIANEVSKMDKTSLLIYFPDLVLELKNSIGTDRFQELVNMLKDVDVLMLDDLGSENMTTWLRDEILGPVINYRLMENKPLFISSNIKPGDLEEHLATDKTKENIMKAKRIISRLNDMVDCIDMSDCEKYTR